MTAPISLFFDAYTAYLQLICDALDGLDFAVYDGPQVTYPDNQSFVAVGVDDLTGPRDDYSAIDTGTQQFVAIGSGPRDETFAINAVLVAWDGDGQNIASVRATAKVAVDAIGHGIRQPPFGTGDSMLNDTLNQAGDGTGWCGLALTRMSQRRNSNGCAVVITLSLPCFARV